MQYHAHQSSLWHESWVVSKVLEKWWDKCIVNKIDLGILEKNCKHIFLIKKDVVNLFYIYVHLFVIF